jgi:hypothetical protein
MSKHLGNILDITHDLGDHIWNGKDPSVFRMMLLKDFRGTQRAAACAMTHDRILNGVPSFRRLPLLPWRVEHTKTMGTSEQQGLFFIGEVLDVYGED